jgi:lipid-A-disaccharide synthase
VVVLITGIMVMVRRVPTAEAGPPGAVRDAPLIGILAGEASGDRLGRGLMVALKARFPAARFVGIGGVGMQAAGLESLAAMDRLAVNGFIDPIRRLPDLLRIFRQLLDGFARERPDLFIGVDFNVFNLLLERRLKRRGVPTVHYVSPSVYAWRRGRADRLGRAADLLLTLYPFEPAFYAHTPLRAVFVGHPLADEIAPDCGAPPQRQAARRSLGLPAEAMVIALLPGSRMAEVRLLGHTLLGAAALIAARRPAARFVVPCLDGRIRGWLTDALRAWPGLQVTVDEGDARRALIACDAALVKSGTSTLEAMLVGRPMVVCYRLGRVSYQLARRLVRTEFVALPNILAGRRLVPELLQDAATPAALADALLRELDKAGAEPEYLAAFRHLHATLRRNADGCAAEAVAALLP